MVSKAFVDQANSFVKKSFGFFYRGNYHIVGGGVAGGTLIEKSYSLEVIASKMAWLGFGDPAMGVGVKGVLSADGSTIVVIRHYKYEAWVYAELYQRALGKEVRIETRKSFEELFPDQGLASRSLFPHDLHTL